MSKQRRKMIGVDGITLVVTWKMDGCAGVEMRAVEQSIPRAML